MNERILCVDDEPRALEGYQRRLRKQYPIDIAAGGEEGLKALEEQGPYAVVVSDMRMPKMNGAQFLRRVRERSPDTVRLMLTAYADQTTAIEAVNQGHIFRFLTKPCSPEVFATALEAGLEQHRLMTAERQLLEQTLNGSISLLTDMLALTDPDTFQDAVELRDEVMALGRALELPSLWDLEMAATLARIGYVTLPPGLAKRFQAGEVLEEEERTLLDHVPEIGARMLDHIPRLESVAQAIRYQAKNYDGSGRPVDDLAGDDIPLGGRILRLAGDLQRLMTGGLERKSALRQMQDHEGYYDPNLLAAALSAQPEAGAREHRPVIVDLYVHRLRPGYRLVSPVETHKGKLLLAAGKVINRVLLERLNNYARFSRIREPLRVDIARPSTKVAESAEDEHEADTRGEE